MTEVSREIEEFAREAVDAAFHLHRRIGPGLLESGYELVLQRELQRRGLKVDRQRPIDIEIDELRIVDAFRADLIVENRLLIELKSIEKIAPVHSKQVLTYIRLMKLTYIRLMNLPLGLLISFGAEVFREGVKRVIINQPLRAFAPLRETTLRLGQGEGQ